LEWADGTCRIFSLETIFAANYALPLLRQSAITGGSPSWCVGGGDSCFECNDCCFVVEAIQKLMNPVVAPEKQELSPRSIEPSSSNLSSAARRPAPEPLELVAF